MFDTMWLRRNSPRRRDSSVATLVESARTRHPGRPKIGVRGLVPAITGTPYTVGRAVSWHHAKEAAGTRQPQGRGGSHIAAGGGGIDRQAVRPNSQSGGQQRRLVPAAVLRRRQGCAIRSSNALYSASSLSLTCPRAGPVRTRKFVYTALTLPADFTIVHHHRKKKGPLQPAPPGSPCSTPFAAASGRRLRPKRSPPQLRPSLCGRSPPGSRRP